MNSLQSKLVLAARSVLGLGFFVFGLNGFLHFLPQPPMSGVPAQFFGALFATGYMLPLIKGTEVLTGLLLLSGRYVPLALTVLAPVMVNILAFHAFLAPAGLLIPIVFAALGIYLAYAHREAFAPMLQARTPLPEVAKSRASHGGRPALST
jgi:uncharacterized membrane protein YphA (DoxX/SURF4 family)